MEIIEWINRIILILFFLCYAYQFVYIPVGIYVKMKRKTRPDAAPHRFAILVAARNEETVIGHLLDSIRAQDYPAEYVDIWVVADNCTDATASVAAAHGAHVVKRQNKMQVGKGYALNYLLSRMPTKKYDAFLVFDADNLLAPDYLTEMNKTFSAGYGIITSYRNSKNYGDNWISAGYALWFLREASFLNAPRMALGHSCAVSGTGFLFSRKVLEACGSWHFFLLTEDIEFTIDRVTSGEKIGYCGTAELFDEQPTRFSQSWRQRMRWSRGYLQVCRHYGGRMIRGMFKGSFSCYDMTMNIMPAAVLTITGLVASIAAVIMNFRGTGSWSALGFSLLQMFISLFLTTFIVGIITTITEWKKIHTSTGKKLLYTLTFPLFMFTYVPICICSLFVRVGWKPIRHEKAVSLSQVVRTDK